MLRLWATILAAERSKTQSMSRVKVRHDSNEIGPKPRGAECMVIDPSQPINVHALELQEFGRSFSVSNALRARRECR